MMTVDLSGLERFIQKVKSLENAHERVLKQVEEIAVDELKKSYSSIHGVSVSAERKSKNIICIYAETSDGKISFIEFGTGFYAKGTYMGELPKKTITFQTKNGIESTAGWEYYYWENQPNPNTKREKNGVKGWYMANGVFSTGRPAGNIFYFACLEIRRRITQEVRLFD